MLSLQGEQLYHYTTVWQPYEKFCWTGYKWKKNSSSNNNKTSFTFQRHSISTKFMRGTFLTGRGKMKVQGRIRTKHPWSFQVSVILLNESKLSSVHFFSQLLAVTLFYVFIFYICNCYFWALKREWNISSFLFGKERGNDVISIGRAVLAEFFFLYWPRFICTGGVFHVLADFFQYIAWVCHPYDASRFCDIDAILM